METINSGNRTRVTRRRHFRYKKNNWFFYRIENLQIFFSVNEKIFAMHLLFSMENMYMYIILCLVNEDTNVVSSANSNLKMKRT